jgi:hypothetical protein
MKPEGALRPPRITVPEPPVPDRPERQEASAADALRTFLIEPLKDGLKETYRVLVTPDTPPAEDRPSAPEPTVIFVGQPPEHPPVAPAPDPTRAIIPALPVSAEERRDRERAHARIEEILEELTQAANRQGER